MKKHPFLILGILFIVSSSSALWANSLDSIGSLSYVEGRVDRKAVLDSEYSPAVKGDSIFPGDIIRTKSNSKAEVVFADKSTAKIADNSQVKIQEYLVTEDGTRENARLFVERGTIRAVVSKFHAGADNFFIETPNALGSVKGSDICISYQKSASTFLSLSGAIETRSKWFPGEAVLVSKGNTTYVAPEMTPQKPRPYLPFEAARFQKETATGQDIAEARQKADLSKAIITRFSGDVRVRTEGKGSWHRAALKEALGENDEIETGENGFLRVELESGRIVELQPNTQMVIRKLDVDIKTGKREDVLESSRGQIRARIEKLKVGSKFSVVTPSAIAAVRGTILYLKITPTATQSFFEAGFGSLTNRSTGQEVEVGAGQNASSDSSGFISDAAPTTAEEHSQLENTFNSQEETYEYSSPDAGGSLGSETGDGSDTNTGLSNDSSNSAQDNVPADNDNTPILDNLITPTIVVQDEQPTVIPPTLTITAKGFFGAFGSFLEDSASEFLATITSINNLKALSPKETEANETDKTKADEIVLSAAGSFKNPHERKLWWTDLDGTSANKGLFKGWFGGRTADFAGILASFYLDPSGTLRTVITSFSSDNHQSGVFSGKAAPLSISLDQSQINTDDLPFDSSISVSEEISGIVPSGLASFQTMDYASQSFGLWRAIISADFSDQDIELNMPFYYAVNFGEDDRLLIGTALGIESSDSRSLDLNLTLNGFDSLSAPSTIDTYIGRIYGQYDNNDHFEGFGVGLYSQEPLFFTGQWGNSRSHSSHDSLYVNDGGYYSHVGSDYGALGSVDSVWSGSGNFIAMGLYSTETNADTPLLWNTSIRSINAHEENETTLDGGAFRGFTTGVWKQGSMEGNLKALYVDPNGNIGILSGSIDGFNVPEANAWYAEGVLQTDLKRESTGIDPVTFISESVFSGEGDGRVFGNFGGDGEIKGHINDFQTLFIHSLADSGPSESWGIFNTTFGGSDNTFSQPEGNQSADWIAGGQAVFGHSHSYEIEDGFGYSQDPGFWIAQAQTTWDEAKITGTLDGSYLSYLRIGSFSGQVQGLYDDGTWIAQSIGTFESEPLSYVAEAHLYLRSFYDEDEYGKSILEGYGSAEGLLGSTSSFWNSGSNSFTFMGRAEDDIANVNFLVFDGYLRSHNILIDQDTAMDGGATYGFVAGEVRGRDLRSKIVGIYVDPQDEDGVSRAGYFFGTGDGEAVQNINMFQMNGNFTKQQKRQDIGILPEALSEALYQDSGRGELEGSFDGESGALTASENLKTTSLVNYFAGIAQNWGIYKQKFEGFFEGLGENTSWSGKMGGHDSFGAYNPTIRYEGQYYYSDGQYSYEYDKDNRYGSFNYYRESTGENIYQYYYADGTTSGYSSEQGYFNSTWDASEFSLEDLRNPLDLDYSDSYSSQYNRANSDHGYWLADLSEGVFADDGVSADLKGNFITPTKIGTIEGNILGIYNIDHGTWGAAGVGTWDGVRNNFSGQWGQEETSLYYNDNGNLNWAGWDRGLIGAAFSPWDPEIPAGFLSFTAIGQYGLSVDESTALLWNTPVNSRNVLNNTNSTLDGGAFKGFSAGFWKDGYLLGSVVSFFISPSGSAGILTADVIGNVYSQIRMWRADAHDIQLDTKEEEFSISPERFNNAIYQGNLSGTLSGGFTDAEDSAINGGIYSGNTYFIYDNESGAASRPWGIYNLKLASDNTFSNPSGSIHPEFAVGGNGTFGRLSNGNDESGYWLAKAIGTWSNEKLQGILSGKYLTSTRTGELSGDLTGLYSSDNQTWVSQSIGTFDGASLTFSGQTYEDSLYYNNNGYYNWSGSDYGYIGGTVSPWSLAEGQASSFIAMGTYYEYNNASTYLWNTPVSSFNAVQNNYSSLDGGAFYGFTHGFWDTENETIDGALTALYIDPNGKAGVLKGSVNGTLYPQLNNLWAAEGSVTATPLSQDLGIDPANFQNHVYSGNISGNLGGVFEEGEGCVKGDVNNGTVYFLYNPDEPIISYFLGNPDGSSPSEFWGIYNLQLGGEDNTYNNPSESSAAVLRVGGSGSFGYYNTYSSDNGYWVAEAETSWQDGKIDGSILGKYLTQTQVGSLSGSLQGLSSASSYWSEELQDYVRGTDGTWVAQSVGTFEGTPLKFFSNIEEASLNSVTSYDISGEEFGVYNSYVEAQLNSQGSVNAYFGGTGSLFSENGSSPIFLIGDYDRPENLSSGLIWSRDIRSQNNISYSDTTYDGGAYRGFIAGRFSGDEADARILAIYMGPQNEEGFSSAGIVRGTLEGEQYPGVGMFSMSGDLTTEEPKADLEFAPDALSGLYQTTGGAGTLYGLTSEGTTISAVDYLQTASLVDTGSFTAQGWGIYSQEIRGLVQTEADDFSWFGFMGGHDPIGHYVTSWKSVYSDYGYWVALTGGEFSADGLVDGALMGFFVSYTKFGVLNGDIFGVANFNEGVWAAHGLGTWDSQPLSVAASWGDGGDGSLYSNRDGRFEYVGDEDGILGFGADFGFEGSADENSFMAIGQFRYDEEDELRVEGKPLLWNTGLETRNVVDENQGSLDGNVAFTGLTAGLWSEDSMKGSIRGIYLKSDGELGLVSGNVEGAILPQIKMWTAQGSVDFKPMTRLVYEYEEGIEEPIYSIHELEDYLYSDYLNGAVAGNFGEEGMITGSLVDAETHFFWNYDYNDGSTEDWGVYQLQLESNNINGFVQPENVSNFSMQLGGDGTFGYSYDEESDWGYWAATVDGTWENGKILGSLEGKYLTYTQIGDLEGDFTGVYENNGEYATWIGQSIGSFQGAPVQFFSESNDISANGRPVGYFEGSYYSYDSDTDTNNEYHYNFYTDNRSGSSTFHNSVENRIEYTDYYRDGSYYRYFRDMDGNDLGDETGTWNDENDSLFFIANNLASGDIYDSYQDVRVEFVNEGSVYSHLGGATSLFLTNETIQALLLSQFDLNGDASDSQIWSDELYSFDYISYQRGTADGGYYDGFFGGLRQASQAQGLFKGIYLGPVDEEGNRQAGILSGEFDGSFYDKIQMVRMDGNLSLEQKAQIQFPGNSYSNLYWTTGGRGELLGESEGCWIQAQDNLTTLSLVDDYSRTAEGWGVYYQDIQGIYESDSENFNWSAKMGGHDAIGFYFTHSEGEEGTGSANSDDGFWVADVEGSFEDGIVRADLNADFITFTKKGTLTGEMLGIFSSGQNTWIANGIGEWESEPLSFAAEVFPFLTQDESDEPVFAVLSSSEEGGLIFNRFGRSQAIMGGTGSLWDGVELPVLTIGALNFENDGNDLARPVLYSLKVRSYDITRDLHQTFDGGAFVGLSTGVLSDSRFFGRTELLYIAPFNPELGEEGAYTIGVLGGELTGEMFGFKFDGDNLWKQDSHLTAENKAQTTSIAPESFENSIREIALQMEGQGSFETGGPISIMTSDGMFLSFDQEQWGIWGSFVGGSVGGELSEGNFSIPLGGQMTPEGSDTAEKYWLGEMSGSVSEGDLSALVKGVWISEPSQDPFLAAGTMTGSAYGSVDSDSGLWQAAALGQWDQQAILSTAGYDEFKNFITQNEVFALNETIASMMNIAGSFNGGAAGSITGTANASFFAASGFNDGFWTALFSGAFSGLPATVDSWSATVADATNGVSATLSGTAWADNQWSAQVASDAASAVAFSGLAQGTYAFSDGSATDGTFEGIGSGLWSPQTSPE